MTDSPLWGTISEPPEINEAWFQLSSYFSKDLNSWGFWKRWYEKVLAGELSDLDIEICTRVAQIPSEIWDAKENAPQKVAAEIAKIEAQFEVRELARATKASVLEAAVQARAEARRHGIGGNLPPEQIEDLQIPTALTIIYESAQTLEEEAEKDEPDVTLVVQAVDALTTVTKWIAGHMDAAIGAAVKAVGTAGGAAIVAWLSGHGDKVTKLLEAAQQWLLAL